MSLRHIVKVLGGDLYDGGARANIPAPGHSVGDRSVSLLLKDGRVYVHTFSSQTPRADDPSSRRRCARRGRTLVSARGDAMRCAT